MIATGSARRLSMFAIARAFAATALLSSAVAVNRLHAQELRGLVLMSDGASPAAGVVAVLMHATLKDSIVARGVTNERGRFLLTAPRNTTTTLRLLRIGFEPMEAGSYSLAAGQVFDASFTLHDNRIKLAAFEVKTASRCQVQPTGAQLVAQLFLQARTALIASTTPLSGTVATSIVNYNRHQDKNRKLFLPVDRNVQTGATLKPYLSIGADSLEKVGYVVTDRSDFTYYAPDADVLLSDKFLARHCLQLVDGKDSLAAYVGIGFRPVTSRRDYVDVSGTLWLDRTTSELQFLEFAYTSLPDYLTREGLGGRVDYARLPDGGWFVNNWFIRMPILGTKSPSSGVPLAFRFTPQVVATGAQLAGGVVQNISLDDRVLYLNSDASRAGSLPGDPVTTTAAAGGNSYAPIAQRDSTTVRSFCGAQMTYEHEGLISGRVFDETHAPYDGAFVKAAWREAFALKRGVVSWQNREVTTISSSLGAYMVCGIAVDRPISMFARRGDRWGRASIARLSEESPTAQLDLMLEPLAKEKDASGKKP